MIILHSLLYYAVATEQELLLPTSLAHKKCIKPWPVCNITWFMGRSKGLVNKSNFVDSIQVNFIYFKKFANATICAVLSSPMPS